jgi:hypothetical protein
MMHWGSLVVGLVLSQATPAPGGGGPPPSAKEIKALIDELVSPNPAPDTAKLQASEAKPDGGFPPGYDHKKQEQVHRARSKLLQLGPRAIPFLIERWRDDRYCMTVEEAEYINQSVGAICRSIISLELQPYGCAPKGHGDPRGKPWRPSYPGRFLGAQESARRWWTKNKDRTLYEMQLEALDWVIAEEAKRPRDFKDEERMELERLRKELVQRGKPFSVAD